MRMVDSNVPCMGKLYHQYFMLSRFAEAVAGDPDAIADIEEAFLAQVLNAVQLLCSKWTGLSPFCSAL